MDTQTFLDDFATISEAPDGPQRLRDLVLELAVRGRLVQEDDGGGTSSTCSNASGGTTPVGPFDIPARWLWTRVGEITDSRLGKMLDKAKNRGPLRPYLRNANVQWFRFELSDIHELRLEDDDLDSHTVQPGDLIICEGGEPGRVAICNEDVAGMVIQKALHRVRPLGGVDSWYLAYVLQSYARSGFLATFFTGATIKHLTGKALSSVPVPLPPLAEQERIVAKVDELMGLCDDLEAHQERRDRATTHFRASALHALTEAKRPVDRQHTWERVDANWPAVTTTAEAVRGLQATVLQLAVEGRLVSRLPQDGTADQTLSAVNDERARLVSEGVIARPKASVADTADEEPYELPEHWRWVHVEDVMTHVVDCLHRTPPYTATGIPAIRTCDVEPGRVLVDKALLVDEATYLEQTRRLIPHEGDVLYSREGGRFGIAAVVPPNTKLCLSQRMMQFRCAAAVSPDYFAWFLNSPLGFGQAAEDVGGSASPHVNIKSIRRFVMPLPPYGEQLRIVGAITEILGAIDDLALSLERQEERASRLVDAASALFTG